MGFFSFLSKNNVEKLPSTEVNIPADVPKSIFINDDQPVMNVRDSSAVWPIEELFDRLGEDYETRGYNEAKSSKNLSAMESGKKLISQDIKIAVEKIMVRYEDMLANVSFEIKSMNDAGMNESALRVGVTKQQIERHIDIIKKKSLLLTDINSDVYAKVVGSYERGYKIGLMEVSENNVNILRNGK